MYPKPIWPGFSAADACATGSNFQIGGFIELNDSRFWFSERFSVAEKSRLWGITNAIGSSKRHRLLRDLGPDGLIAYICIPISSPTTSRDSPYGEWYTSAEAGVNQLFTTSEPLCFFLEKIGQLSSSLNVDMDTSHISGVGNVVADLLSRWDFKSTLPTGFTPSNRVRLTLSELWMIKSSLRVVPQNLQLLWALPTS